MWGIKNMKKVFSILIISFFLLIGFSVISVNSANNFDTNDGLRPVMKMDFHALEKWKEEYNNAEKFINSPSVKLSLFVLFHINAA